MKLYPPFHISARLMPAVTIADATISLNTSDRQTRDGRDIYEVYIDFADGREFEITDLRSSCFGGSYYDGMSALLSFLSAAADSYAYCQRTGNDGEMTDLFEPPIVEWAHEHSDDIAMMAIEVDENPVCEICGEPAGAGGALCPVHLREAGIE